jgi:hypothetical protein
MENNSMQATMRSGENGNIPFRTDRFFTVSGNWYFSTREGFDSGPYIDKARAEDGLKRFLKVAKLIPGAEEVNRMAHRMY